MTDTNETTETEEQKMLRLHGALTLGNMIFGGHRCHCHHHHHHGGFLGRGLLLGLFMSRANEKRTEEV